MDDNFRDKLKRQSDNLLEAVSQADLYSKHFVKYTRQRTRIKEAMINEEQGKLMFICSSGGDACGSIFCDRCLDKRQRNMFASYNNYIDKTFLGDEGIARDRLRWITVLHNVVKVRYSSNKDEDDTIKECVESAKNLKNIIGNLSRNNKRIWLRGAIHAELIDYSLYEYFTSTGGATEKVITISDFINSSGYDKHNTDYKDTMFDSLVSGEKELYFLIHFHALADIGDYKDKEFRKKLTDRWNITKRQIDIGRIWDEIDTKDGTITHKLDDAIKGMSRYCYTRSNARLTFSKNWGAGEKIMNTGLRNGYGKSSKQNVITYAKEINDRDLDNDLSLSVGELRLLIKVHNAISGSNNDGLNISIYKKH
ncbi:hypothetical protein EB001_18165 [bacterium]|jgi:hypothetical protein|nr:hypothetical protein [bacterium]